MTLEEANAYLVENLSRIRRKLDAGETLTEEERNALVIVRDSYQAAESEPAPAPKPERGRATVRTYAALAEELGVTKQVVNYWKKYSDAPQPTRSGRHRVEEWREFAARHRFRSVAPDVDSDALAAAKLRKLHAEADIAESKAGALRGETITVDEMSEYFSFIATRSKQWLLNAAENELPPLLSGADEDEVRRRLVASIEEFSGIVREWAGKYMD